MAHMIDNSTGADAIAFVGETPWHGLGQRLTPGQPIDVWSREAKLDWSVEAAKVNYEVPGDGSKTFEGRNVLYRSDTKAPLSVVSDRFNVVQPAEILAFFEKLVAVGGFQLEVAGALSGGKRVWALAKVGEGADVVDGDLVKPYLLLGTSYDGTMATIAKFTPIRVVCNNTITAAIGADGALMEGDVDKGYLKSVVRVLHREKFDADAVRQQLGVVTNEFERFLIKSRQLAHVELSKEQADEFVASLMTPYYTGEKDVRESRGYKRVIELFSGAAKGSNFAPGTRWQMLNAVTELVDHERGRSDNTRLESAWFGTGSAIKNKALELLAA